MKMALRPRGRSAPVLPLGLAAGAFCLLFVAPARAGLLHTDAQATMSSGVGFSTTYLPIGTVVTASVDFDLGPGAPSSFPPIALASGTFTWNDGTPRTFNVSSASVTGLVSTGLVTIDFLGTGPTIGGLTATGFGISYDIGVNPFMTSNDLSDLLVSSTIERLRVGVSDNSGLTNNGELATDVSGSTTAVPEPASLTLVSLGIGGLIGYGWRRKRRV